MKKNSTLLLMVVAIACMILLVGCGEQKADTIVGSWKYSTGDYTYTFNEDGTGKYDVSGTAMEFTYKTEGNKISILYTGSTAPFESEYELNGNELNIKDSLGNDTIYKRK